MADEIEQHEALTELKLRSNPSDIADPDAEIVALAEGERYEWRARLGEGGMGEVLLARDRVIGREVAMKVVLESVAQRSEMRARFIREARVQGQLEHPSIAPVYDFGLDAEGRTFFTMKRVRGVTLERILDALRRGDEATAQVYTRHKLLAAFVQVCLAVDFANERGVLHRDLKPSNVMLGGHGEVYVLDWGLAKVRSASQTLEPLMRSGPLVPATADAGGGPSSSRVRVAQEVTSDDGASTEFGALLGTPGYMAPEQIKGIDVGTRSDVYSLGAILFELLTLQPLHGAGPAAAMLNRALAGVEARPSVRAPARDVAPELEAACVAACAKESAVRMGRARDLADAIEAFLSGDRDLEVRQELANVYLGRARQSAAQALGPGASADDRREALRDVGRAITLVPDHPEAVALLVSILSEVPKVPPPEVVASIERAAHVSQRRMLPRLAMAYAGTWLVFLPFEVLVGIRNVTLALVPMGLWLVTAALALLAYRLDHRRLGFPYVGCSAAIALAASTVLAGPLLMAPTVAAVIAQGMALEADARTRRFTTVSVLVAVVVPAALAWAGLHPVPHRFVDGALVVGPGAIALPRNGIFLLMTTVHVIVIAIAAHFSAAYRDTITALEIRSHTHAWQLRQLVPPAAANVMEPALPEDG